MRVLVAGITGSIGGSATGLLRDAGIEVTGISRALGRDALKPETLDGCCKGVEVVVSAMGGSVALGTAESRGYAVTNTKANANLLREAEGSGVRRFIYLAAHSEPGYAATAYMRAHEAFVSLLRQSGLSFTVLRPTGVFSALAAYLDFARRGAVPLIGDGLAKTNPIDAGDVGRAVVEFLNDGPEDVSLGGPEILTRREIGEIAGDVIDKRPLFLPAPPAVARFNARLTGVFHRRLGELIEFAAAVSVQDCIAPLYGKRTLRDYFAHLASSGRSSSADIVPGR